MPTRRRPVRTSSSLTSICLAIKEATYCADCAPASRCKDALVLVVTSSDSQRDREDMDAFGANGYFRKPSEFSEFMKLGELVRDLLAQNETPPS